MKILKIEFENINSLKGKHLIDFQKEPFSNSSLFAITGPTGSGKSTLLDVICLALFNRVPRLGSASVNEIKRTGAIITQNQKEAMASVTYLGKEGVFCSEWSISTARTGNLRNYEMHLVQVETNAVLNLKKSEVPAANQQKTGLNYDQFVKSVLLAQGDFAEFLKAKKDVRGDLLEKITGTGIYRQLGRRAFEKFKQENKAIEAQQNHIALLKDNLLDEEQEKNRTEAAKTKKEELQQLEEGLKSLEQQLEVKKEIEHQEQTLGHKEAEKQKAEKNLIEFGKHHGSRLREHEKVAPQAENLREWSRLRKEKESLADEHNKIGGKSKDNQTGLSSCLKKAEKLVGKPVETEKFTAILQLFGEEIRQLETQKTQKEIAYKTKAEAFTRELDGIDFSWHPKTLADDFLRLETLQGQAENQLKKWSSELNTVDQTDLPNEKIRLAEQMDKIREAEQQELEMLRQEKEVAKYHTELKDIEHDKEKLPEIIKTAKEKTILYNARVEKLTAQRELQLLRASLEELRHQLKEGSACPLCGAEHHPYAHDLPEKNDGLAKDLAKSQKDLKIWQAEKNRAETQLKSLTQQQKKHLQTKDKLSQSLAVEKENFQANFSSFFHQTEHPEWKILLQTTKNQLLGIDSFEKETIRLKALNRAVPFGKTLQDILKEGLKLRSQLNERYQGDNIDQDVSTLGAEWTRLQEAEKHFFERAEEIKNKQENNKKALEVCEENLLSFVSSQGFESIVQAEKVLLSEVESSRLRTQRQQIQDKIKTSESAMSVLVERLKTYRQKDVPEGKEALRRRQIEMGNQKNKLSEENNELLRLLTNHKETQQKLAQLRQAIAEKQKQTRKWQLLNELIGDAKGKTFNDFAQDLNLKHLIHLANKRLKSMSDRYLIDQPKENEDDSLTVIDQEMGGQRRSVKTLSGGETFILSLSMALALSDLASKNVEIKSLFIDEGFGTLDQETLDQTLDTLERLQAESSKTIGIISHVESLKERISTQIQLSRNGQGYSSLSVSS